MTFKANGNAFGSGDFNRDLEYGAVFTAFEMTDTGVDFTRDELVTDGVLTSATLSASNSITIEGVQYTVDGTYDNAYWGFQNFKTVINAVRGVASISTLALVVVAGDSATQLDAVRLPGEATAGAGVAFGTNLVGTTAGYWAAMFNVEGVDTLATSEDREPRHVVAAATAIVNIEAELTGAALFFNTTLGDLSNEDSMGGALDVGDAVDGEVSVGDRNFVVRLSALPLA